MTKLNLMCKQQDCKTALVQLKIDNRYYTCPECNRHYKLENDGMLVEAGRKVADGDV